MNLKHPRRKSWCVLAVLALTPAAVRAASFTYNLPGPGAQSPSGKHWISLPSQIVSPTITDARDLCDAIGSSAARVTRMFPLSDSTTYDCSSTTCNLPDCFPVSAGEGYQIELGAPATFVIQGTDAAVPIGLNPAPDGFLISVPLGKPVSTAEELTEEIDAGACKSAVLGVSRYVTTIDAIEHYSAGGGGVNFPIQPGVGYLVQVAQSASYDPGSVVIENTLLGGAVSLAAYVAAQSFVPTKFYNVNRVELRMGNINGAAPCPVGTYIQDGPNVGSTVFVQSTSIVTGHAWWNFPLAADLVVSKGTTYDIRAEQGCAMPDNIQWARWGMNAYNGGSAYLDGAAIPADFAFRIFARCIVGAPPGQIPPPGLQMKRVSFDEAQVSWTAADCSDGSDYGIYRGELGVWYSHSFEVCLDGGDGLTETLPLPAGNAYYLVVPNDGLVEGSYGSDSRGVERPTGSATCVSLQDTSCP